MKVLNSSQKINNNGGRIHQIVEFNNKKFKIISALENGRTTLEARIMNSDGVFDFILSNNDLNYDFNDASYVSSQNIKDAALNEGLDKMKELIKKIYK
jgi:protein-tyrosine-phosphatase